MADCMNIINMDVTQFEVRLQQDFATVASKALDEVSKKMHDFSDRIIALQKENSSLRQGLEIAEKKMIFLCNHADETPEQHTCLPRLLSTSSITQSACKAKSTLLVAELPGMLSVHSSDSNDVNEYPFGQSTAYVPRVAREANPSPPSEAMPGSRSIEASLQPSPLSAVVDMQGSCKAVGRTKSMVKKKKIMKALDTSLGRIVGRIVTSQYFEITVYFIILLNFAFMGAEAHYFVVEGLSASSSILFTILENLFTFFFVSELALRVLTFGIRVYIPEISGDNVWNFLDLVIVATSVVASWIIPMVELFAGQTVDRSFLRTLKVLRALRLLRFLGMMRRVECLKEVWIMIEGLTDALRILAITIIVTFVVVFLFAVFGLILISRPIQDSYLDVASIPRHGQTSEGHEGSYAEVHEWTFGIDKFMYLLVNILVADEYSHILKAIQDLVPWSWVYFYFFIAVGRLVIMNLITAIIIDNAFLMSKNNEDVRLAVLENERRQFIDELEEMFDMMDMNSDGTINWEEFEKSFSDPELASKWKLMEFSNEDYLQLFNLLDNGQGIIDMKEFFEGLKQMRGQARANDKNGEEARAQAGPGQSCTYPNERIFERANCFKEAQRIHQVKLEVIVLVCPSELSSHNFKNYVFKNQQ